IVSELDPNLDPRSFRLGDLKLGDLNVHIPNGLGSFQGDFGFTQRKGVILRVSAGFDIQSNKATWLLQAIDPSTGEVLQNPSSGLLAPNDARGAGRGFIGFPTWQKGGLARG